MGTEKKERCCNVSRFDYRVASPPGPAQSPSSCLSGRNTARYVCSRLSKDRFDFGISTVQTDSLPLEVSADLIFCLSPSSCKSSLVVVQRRTASCWLDAVDFLSVSCSLTTDLSSRGGFGGGDGDGGRPAAKTFSRSIGGATLKHIRYGAIAFAFPFVKVVLPLFQDLAAFRVPNEAVLEAFCLRSGVPSVGKGGSLCLSRVRTLWGTSQGTFLVLLRSGKIKFSP